MLIQIDLSGSDRYNHFYQGKGKPIAIWGRKTMGPFTGSPGCPYIEQMGHLKAAGRVALFILTVSIIVGSDALSCIIFFFRRFNL
jgi:hypothetical protein